MAIIILSHWQTQNNSYSITSQETSTSWPHNGAANTVARQQGSRLPRQRIWINSRSGSRRQVGPNKVIDFFRYARLILLVPALLRLSRTGGADHGSSCHHTGCSNQSEDRTMEHGLEENSNQDSPSMLTTVRILCDQHNRLP